jgi:hypothetical protein
MEFVFVPNATVHDKSSRKLIRSHCMRGKNVGKTRARRTEPKSQHHDSDGKKKAVNQMMSASLQSVISDRLATINFPARLDDNMHELLYRCTCRQNYPKQV